MTASRPYSLVPLRKALASLIRALSEPENEFTRDSVIQRFEFTLELSWKAMKARLESSGISLPEPTPRGVVRSASKVTTSVQAEIWIEFINQRNQTSHSYNESVALGVYQAAKRLPGELESVLLWLDSD